MTPVTFFVPGQLDNPLNGAHGHWSLLARRRKAWREKTHAMVLAEGIRLDPHTRKRVTFLASTWNHMDDDGLSAALKSVRDGLVDAGVLDGDAVRQGHEFVYGQKIDRQRRGVQVTVDVLECMRITARR